MAKTLTPPEALHRAAALCSASEHCIADIRQKLTRWGIGNNDAQSIVDRLVQERFIDENRYAVAFAKDKFRFSGWGRIKIRYTLQQKQISDSDIAEALAVIDEGQYTARLLDLLKTRPTRWPTKTRNPAAPSYFGSLPPEDLKTDLSSMRSNLWNYESRALFQRIDRPVLPPALSYLPTSLEPGRRRHLHHLFAPASAHRLSSRPI